MTNGVPHMNMIANMSRTSPPTRIGSSTKIAKQKSTRSFAPIPPFYTRTGISNTSRGSSLSGQNVALIGLGGMIGFGFGEHRGYDSAEGDFRPFLEKERQRNREPLRDEKMGQSDLFVKHSDAELEPITAMVNRLAQADNPGF
jgi:hypothetical protein